MIKISLGLQYCDKKVMMKHKGHINVYIYYVMTDWITRQSSFHDRPS